MLVRYHRWKSFKFFPSLVSYGKQVLFSSREDNVYLGKYWFSIVYMAFSVGLVLEKYWFSIVYTVCIELVLVAAFSIKF